MTTTSKAVHDAVVSQLTSIMKDRYGLIHSGDSTTPIIKEVMSTLSTFCDDVLCGNHSDIANDVIAQMKE